VPAASALLQNYKQESFMAEALPALQQLSKLNLRGNGITFETAHRLLAHHAALLPLGLWIVLSGGNLASGSDEHTSGLLRQLNSVTQGRVTVT
jgi:hypothetical protein